MGRLSITVVTNQTSPYQVELFNEVEHLRSGQTSVVYLHSKHAGRFWGPRSIGHDHLILDEDESKFTHAAAIIGRAELAVFNFYNHPFAYRLLRARVRSGKGWCFWGRTGSTRMAWAGGWFRRWKSRDLAQQQRSHLGNRRVCA